MPEAPDMMAMIQNNLQPPAPPKPAEPKQITETEAATYKAAGWTDEQLSAGGYVVVPDVLTQPDPAPAPTEANPAPAPKRGRPTKPKSLSLLEKCATGGLVPQHAREYLDLLAEIEE
jgi:hypothetical protein